MNYLYNDIRLLIAFLKKVLPYKYKLSIGIVMMLINIASAIFIPFMLKNLVDQVLQQGDKDAFALFILLFFVIILVGYISELIYSYFLSYVGQQALCDLRLDVFEHCLKLPMPFFDTTPIGVILARLTSDFESIGESISTGIFNLLTDIIKTLLFISILLYMDYKLAITIIIIIPIVFYSSSFIRAILRTLYTRCRKTLATSTGYLQECLHGMQVIQLYNAENYVLKKYNSKNKQFLKAQYHSNFYESLLTAFIEAFTSITLAIIIWQAYSSILLGLLSFGVLFSFINIIQRFFVPIRELSQRLTAIQRAIAAISQVQKTLNFDKEDNFIPKNYKKQLNKFQSLVFENVSFGYHDNEAVLKNISFEMKLGCKLALIGKTGSGKTTLFKLILKHYTNYTGKIWLNGIDLKTIQRSQIDHLFSIMSQSTYMFNDTIKNNIDLKKQLSDKEFEKIIVDLHLHQIMNKLPKKFDTLLGTEGSGLSEGEMQLLAVARVMATGASLILLDEATSSIDSMTEQLVQQAIKKLYAHTAMIVIAHRLSTIENSDQIIVMKDGQIEEQGQPATLKQQKGYYAELMHL